MLAVFVKKLSSFDLFSGTSSAERGHYCSQSDDRNANNDDDRHADHFVRPAQRDGRHLLRHRRDQHGQEQL